MHAFKLLPHKHARQWIATVAGPADFGFFRRENPIAFTFPKPDERALVPTYERSMMSARNCFANGVVAVTHPNFQKGLPDLAANRCVRVVEPHSEFAITVVEFQLGPPFWVDHQAGYLIS